MPSLLDSVAALKRAISWRGFRGVNYSEVLGELTISPKLGVFIARRFLALQGFTFMAEGRLVCVDEYTDPTFASIHCVGPALNFLATCGVESAGAVTDDSLLVVMEQVLQAGHKGLLISEIKGGVAATQAHQVADKLVLLGLVVKRSIFPTQQGNPRAGGNKAVLLHLKQFARDYVPSQDGVRIVHGLVHIQQVIDYIHEIMHERHLHIMTATDLARSIGLSARDFIAVRVALLTHNKSEASNLRVFEGTFRPLLEGRDGTTLGIPRAGWYIERVGLAPDPLSPLSYRCMRNLALCESVAVVIEQQPGRDDGIATTDIRALTAVPMKRAQKLFLVFEKQLQYATRKVQRWKQTQQVLLPKGTADRSLASADTVDMDDKSARNDDPAGLSNLGLSDRQAFMEGVILDFLCQRGGAAVLQEVVKEAREAHARSGVEYRLDRRTLQRTLDRMFTTECITRRTLSPADLIRLTDPQGDTGDTGHTGDDKAWLEAQEGGEAQEGAGGAVEVLIRADAVGVGGVESCIRHALKRKAEEAFRPQRRRNIDGENVADGDTQNVQKERFRGLKGKRRLDDPFLFHTPLASADEVDSVLHSAPPGLFLACLAFHYHIAQGVRRHMEDLSAPQPPIDLVIADTLWDMPIHFFLNFSEGFRGKVMESFLDHPEESDAIKDFLLAANAGEFDLRRMETFEMQLSSRPLRDYLDLCKYEQAVWVCFLLANGLLRVASAEGLRTFLMGTKDAHLLGLAADYFADASSTSEANFGGHCETKPSALRFFAALFLHLVDRQAVPEGLIHFFLAQPYQLCVIPTGAWGQTLDALSVYCHWKKVLLPSLPIAWEGLGDVTDLSILGRYILHYCQINGTAGDVPRADGGDRKYFKHTRQMATWGVGAIKSAWEGHEFSWTCFVRSPVSIAAHSVPFVAKAARHAPREPKAQLIPDGASSVEQTGPEAGGREAGGKEGVKEAGGKEGGKEGGKGVFFDAELEEDLVANFFSSSLLGGYELGVEDDSEEWSNRQVALLMEAFLLSFFRRQLQGPLPKALERARKRKRAPEAPEATASPMDPTLVTYAGGILDVVEPRTSFFDIAWAEIDFAFIPDSALSLVPLPIKIREQKVIRNRVQACLKKNPTVRRLVAWLICNKGSRLSGGSARVLNHILQDSLAQGRQMGLQIASRIYQVCGPDPPSLAAAHLKTFDIDLVTEVFRELYIRGLIKAKKSDQGKPTSGSFETSETFADFTCSLAGPYLDQSTPSTSATRGASVDFPTLVDCDLPTRIMAFAQCLSAQPAAVRTAHHIVPDETGLGANVSTEPNQSHRLVKLADSHSGFCNTVLNSIHCEVGTCTPPTPPTHRSAHRVGLAQGGGAQESVDNTYRLFAAKVIAQLADRPGASVSMIHTALHLLSADQTRSLLRTMVGRRLIYSKRGAGLTLSDPFQARRRGTGARADREAPVHYFVYNGTL